MGLSFGWRATEVHESHWIDDPAFDKVSAAAKQAWNEDAEAHHLKPFATLGQPDVITFRTLTPDETRMVIAYFSADLQGEALGRAYLMCFRIAVDFPGAPEMIQTPEGERHQRIVRERGVRMLAGEFVAAIDATYRGIVLFYGKKVFEASFLTDAEKKASSLRSTPTPSSEEGSTPASTASPSPPTASPAGA